MSKKQGKYLRRYTSLKQCKQILTDGQLSLRDPEHWDDKNDKFQIELYRQKSGYASVVALCFTMSTETHHHWKSYGPSGTKNIVDETVCVEFHRRALEEHVEKVNRVRSGEVEYLLVRELKGLPSGSICRLPFIKREGFSDEREWRVIAGVAQGAELPTIPFDLASIKRIILNPTFQQDRRKEVSGELRKLAGSTKISVEQSYLTNSKQWKAAAEGLSAVQLALNERHTA